MSEEKKTKVKNPSFEKALDRLETVVEQMESGDLSLEKMISHFEEGSELVKFCSKKLNEVEQKIEILVKEGETIKPKPFEESPD